MALLIQYLTNKMDVKYTIIELDNTMTLDVVRNYSYSCVAYRMDADKCLSNLLIGVIVHENMISIQFKNTL